MRGYDDLVLRRLCLMAKGGIENANGRLRRWLPRHLDIDRTSDQDIQEIVLTTNLTPRICLGFKTPFQALIAALGRDVQIRFLNVALRDRIQGARTLVASRTPPAK